MTSVELRKLVPNIYWFVFVLFFVCLFVCFFLGGGNEYQKTYLHRNLQSVEMETQGVKAKQAFLLSGSYVSLET